MFLLPSATPSTPSRIIAVPSELIPLAGDGNSALFLAQVLFWWKLKGRQKFYKFNSPCTHALYRTGDSWQEELGLKRTMFMTARRRVALKVRISCQEEIQQAFDEGALVVYGTDEHHLTWYMVNEAALRHRSPALYARLLGSESSPGSASVQPHRPTPRPQPAKVASDSPQYLTPPPATIPAPRNAFSDSSAFLTECRLSPSAEDESLHSLMQGSCTGITEISPEPASEIRLQNHLPVSSIPLPTPNAPAGEGGRTAREGHRVDAIFTGLQGRGVQAEPARLIARRAIRAGWDAHQILAVFDAHRLDAKRAGVRSPVAVAVARMVKNEQISLPPADILARVRWLHQAQVEAERQGAADHTLGMTIKTEIGGRGNDRGGEAVDRRLGTEAEREPSHLKTLWKQVLGDIKLQVTRATFDQHFRGTWLDARDGAYVVCAENPYTGEWLAHRLQGLITDVLMRWSGANIVVKFA